MSDDKNAGEEAKNKSTTEDRLRWFGRVVTVLYSVGYSAVITVFVSYLSFLSLSVLGYGGLIPILLAVFLADLIFHWYLYKSVVPEVFVKFFTGKIFKDLTPSQKKVMGLGIFLGLGGGFALAGLTCMKVLAAIIGIMGAACSPVGWVLGGILALAAFLAFAGLIISWVSKAIEKKYHLEIAAFFAGLVTREENKTRTQHGLEVFFKLLFTSSIITLTLIGMIATLGTLQKVLIEFLHIIPDVNEFACKLASSLITFVMMGFTKVPWALHSVGSAFSQLGKEVGKLCYRFVRFLKKQFWSCIGASVHVAEELSLEENDTIEKKPDVSSTALIFQAGISLIHGFSTGALTAHSGDILNDITDSIGTPISEAEAAHAAMVSGGVMAAALGIFTLGFQHKEPQADSKEATENGEEKASAAGEDANKQTKTSSATTEPEPPPSTPSTASDSTSSAASSTPSPTPNSKKF